MQLSDQNENALWMQGGDDYTTDAGTLENGDFHVVYLSQL